MIYRDPSRTLCDTPHGGGTLYTASHQMGIFQLKGVTIPVHGTSELEGK
jgi:hypothetical protein